MIGTPCLSTRAFGPSQTDSHSILLDKTPAVKHMHTVRRNRGSSTLFIGLLFRLRSTDPARSPPTDATQAGTGGQATFPQSRSLEQLPFGWSAVLSTPLPVIVKGCETWYNERRFEGPPLAELGRRKLKASDCPAAHKARELGGRERTPLSVGCEMDWVVNESDDE